MTNPGLEVGPGGWTRYIDAQLQIDVMIRFSFEADGRRARAVQAVVTSLEASEQRGALGERIRGLHWGQVEALANTPNIAELIRQRLGEEFDLGQIGQPVSGPIAASDRDERKWLEVVDSGAEIDNSSKPATITNVLNDRGWDRVSVRRVDPKLNIPEGGKYPDSFYESFADSYSASAASGESPAVVISEANGVARTTVHRWAKEARRRGLLAPGRKGRST